MPLYIYRVDEIYKNKYEYNTDLSKHFKMSSMKYSSTNLTFRFCLAV